MKLFRVSKQKEKDAIDVKRINSFGIVTVHYRESNDKYFELWFKTEGNENLWNCAISERVENVDSNLAAELGLDAYMTEFDLVQYTLINLINELIAEKCFLIPMGNRFYVGDSEIKTYLVDEINIDENGVIDEGQKAPSKFFEPIDIIPNPLSFLINNIRPVYDKVDDSLVPIDVYIPVSIMSNSIYNYNEEDDIFDTSLIKHVTYRRHPKGLYYAEAITRENGVPKIHIVLNYYCDRIDDKLYLKMFSNLRELDDYIDDLFDDEMKLLKVKALIKKVDFDKYQEYINEFIDCNYYKEVPNLKESKESNDDEDYNIRIINKDQISKLHYKEFRNEEEIKYKLFIDMYKHTDSETDRLYIQIGDGYYEYNQMRDDITNFVNGKLVIELTEHDESEKCKARFISNSISESDYKEIDLNDFK